MKTISNTTVLSNFAGVGQIDLLRQIFGQVYLPTEVHDEIQTGLNEGYSFYRDLVELIHPFNMTGWLYLTSLKDETELNTLTILPKTLHAGEAACLVIARQRDWLFLTDDRAARRVAKEWDVALSGSIGCLVFAVERGACTLSEANQFLLRMIRTGYYSPVTDLSSLL